MLEVELIEIYESDQAQLHNDQTIVREDVEAAIVIEQLFVQSPVLLYLFVPLVDLTAAQGDRTAVVV